MGCFSAIIKGGHSFVAIGPILLRSEIETDLIRHLHEWHYSTSGIGARGLNCACADYIYITRCATCFI